MGSRGQLLQVLDRTSSTKEQGDTWLTVVAPASGASQLPHPRLPVLPSTEPGATFKAMQIGPYLLHDELGRGGAGSVLRAEHVETGEKVALKLLEARDARGRARFEREVVALGRLSHPGVVRLLDSGWHQDRPYLVMELIVGTSLQQHLDRRGALGSERVAELADALAEALQHVHAQGLLHRDLKPDNVLLTQDGRAVLADFGLVKDLEAESEADALSRTGICLGTPGFWAPEQATGSRDLLGPATDVYGLGAVLYAALTRTPPFSGASLAEVLVATNHARLVPPSEHGASVDPRLEQIVLRCLARDPRQRFPSALALRQALAGRKARPASRAPLLAGGALLFASLGVGVLGTLALLDEGDRPQTTASVPPTSPVATPKPSSTPTPSPQSAQVLELVNSARAKLARQELAEAKKLLDRALELDPDSTEALVARAHALMGLGHAGRASKDIERAIGVRPEDPDLYCELGTISALRKRFLDAERCLAEAIRLDPQHWKAYLRRAILRGTTRRYEEALEDFRRSLELHFDVETLCHRAELLEHLGRRAEAFADLEAGIAAPRNEKTWMAYYRRAQLRVKLGQELPAALQDFTTAIELNPDELELFGARALLHHQLGDSKAALRDFDLLLERNPNHVAARVNRSGVRGDCGDHQGALEDLNEVIRQAPGHAPAYHNRGYTYLIDLKDPQRALPDLQQAVRLAPQDSDSHYALGVAYIQLGRQREGALAFEESLRDKPKRYAHEQIRAKIAKILGRPSRY